MRKSEVTFFWRGPVLRWFSRALALIFIIGFLAGSDPRIPAPGMLDGIIGLTLGIVVPLALRRPLVAAVEQGAARELGEGYPDIEIVGSVMVVLSNLAASFLTVLAWFALRALPGAGWPWLAAEPGGGPTMAFAASCVVTAELIGRWYDRLPC